MPNGCPLNGIGKANDASLSLSLMAPRRLTEKQRIPRVVYTVTGLSVQQKSLHPSSDLSTDRISQLPSTAGEKAEATDAPGNELLQRAQWLRAAILGANDGLLSTTSLMLGVGAARDDRRSMVFSGIAGALAGALSMAVGEFVSVSTQREIEQANLEKRQEAICEEEALPNPYKAAAASALAFLCGSLFPLLPAIFVAQHTLRVVFVVVVASIALALFGGVGAHLGGSPVKVSAARVLVGGWIAMGITYGLLKPFDKDDDK
ncbi:vacuolar iron transporter homolog 5-like [Eucalyptus grandis]|uniref:vacuolar iron transporter homolog 5-like n=1 Tax=Eucalyptus grandis TaxID=71139 RepID=UPI00192EB878|nr:vacuolar iron transporter homolog 5-like [Eucalyptus grandis]